MVSRAILIAVLAAIGGWGGPTAGEPLRVGACVWPGYEPFFLARATGALRESEVKLIQFRSSTQTMNAIRTGSIEAAALTLDEAITIAAEGVALTIVQVLDVSSGADVILAQPGIESMAALKGKRIGVETSAMGAYFLLRALELSGMSLESVTLVRLEPRGQIEAFRNEEISAVVCFEPVRAVVRELGGKEIFSTSQMPGEILDVVAVRTEALDAFRPAVAHLAEAWEAALAYRRDDPGKAYEILGRRLGVDGAGARLAYEGLELLDCAESARWMGPGGPLEVAMAGLRDFMVREDLIEAGALPEINTGAACDGGDR